MGSGMVRGREARPAVRENFPSRFPSQARRGDGRFRFVAPAKEE
jgi:hypothetical protein